MDYNKAKTFISIVNAGSITEAANRLFRTQQAISLQLKSVEEELGVILYDRRGPQLILTRDGEALYRELSPAFTEIENAVYRLQNERMAHKGVIKLGFWMEQMTTEMPRLVTGFRSLYPDVQFDITIDVDEGLEQAVLDNSIDFGFFVSVKDRRLVETIPAFSRELILVASAEYLSGQQIPVSVNETFALDLVDYTAPYASYPVWVRVNAPQFAAKAKKKLPVVRVSSDLGLKSLVECHHGMAVLPLEIVESEIATGEIARLLPKTARSLRLDADIGFKRRQTLPFLQQEFLQFARAQEVM